MHLTSTESYTKNYKYLWQFAIRQVLNNLRDKKNKRKSFLISIAALKDYEDDIDDQDEVLTRWTTYSLNQRAKDRF